MGPKPGDGAETSPSSSIPPHPPPLALDQASQPERARQDQTPEARRTPWTSNLEDLRAVSSPMQSAGGESPYGQLNPTSTDRVYPIRSVVSVDPNSTPMPKVDTSTGYGFPGATMRGSAGTDRRYDVQRHPKNTMPLVGSSPNSGPDDSPSKSQRNIKTQEATAQEHIDSTSASVFQNQRPSRKVEGERMGGARQIQTFTDISSSLPQSTREGLGVDDNRSVTDSVNSTQSMNSGRENTGGLITARFKHVVTNEGHAVIVGRDGDALQRCEDEPIHIPGAVQGFGLLIALQETNDDKLQVRVVSENSGRIIGYTPKQLFELDSFCDILSEEQTDHLLDHIDFIKDEDADPATNGPDVFTLAIRTPARKVLKMWCAMHINESNRGLIICEFELEDDPVNPLVPADESTAETPEDTLNSDPTPEEYAESTINASKPLRVLRGARKRRGEAAAMEVFNILSQVQEQLANAANLDAFLKILVGVVKELTGFHRVMIYQFDSAWNGKVVTELVDPRATKDLYKGLHFPASDIPKQARDLYKVNKVRLLYDRDQETARLVCRTLQDIEHPLDLTFSYLRAMSPIHIKYLANMAVRASMSISINAFNELWGLIACHSYGAKGMRVSFPIRKMCRLVGDSASRNIERLTYASRLQARKLINTVPIKNDPSGLYIVASSDELLSLFDADYGLLSIRDETKILGKLEQTQEALAMLEYLRMRKIASITDSIDVGLDFPDLRYPPGFSVIAGLLLVPLSVSGNDFIVFFRKGQVREVKWAGNPYEKFIKGGTEGFLEPRQSFKTWSETVVGTCREWTEEQIETAAVLCLVYGKFIEVWRQKEAALQNSQLTRLLLANSAHEVRTPLNAIINYLEIALEGAIDQETRDNLSKSHSASKSLIYVINDLLDLTKTEEGHNLIKDEMFDLPATIKEAADSFIGDAKRKNIEYTTTTYPGVPQFVIGDQRRVRQAVSNVVANAIRHTVEGAVKIEGWLSEKSERRVDIDIAVQDTGSGMAPEKLDALFRELEQIQTEDDEGLQLKLSPNKKAIEGKEQPKRTLGLGLALVARIVRNMDGQLRVKSEQGNGSRFVIQLGFGLPNEDEMSNGTEGVEATALAPPSSQATTPPGEKGEIMLVNKSAQKMTGDSPYLVGHRRSNESMRSTNSVKSFGSSTKSGKGDVDRLIDAIQEPHMVAKLPTNDTESGITYSDSQGVRHQGSMPSIRRPTSGLLGLHSASSVSTPSSKQPMNPREGPDMLSVLDQMAPIKPIKMPDECGAGSQPLEQRAQDRPTRNPSRVLFGIPDRHVAEEEQPKADKLQVLVAEDDPINSKIIKKRLEKIGHEVRLTINGEECSSTYGEKTTSFDVVLMDMQMPIVDGLTSTKMIRSWERTHPDGQLSKLALLNGRVPIFAVSASLLERERQTYIEAGFDGWILKPIDFKRLSTLLSGIVEQDTRESCLYKAGQWERGGWFDRRHPDVFSSVTAPSRIAPVASSDPH